MDRPGRILAVVLVVLALAGCGRGTAVRERILASESPLIGDAYSYDDGQVNVVTVHVALLPIATKADAARFWCDIVVPAGGTHDTSGVMVTLSIQGGSAGFGNVAEDVVCPTS